MLRKTPRQIADERFGRGRDRAARQSVEPKRSVSGADQARHAQTVIREQPFDLAIFSLPQHDRQPAIGALTTIERRFGRPVANAIDHPRLGKVRYQALINFAVDADTIRPGKLLRGMFEKTRELAGIGEQEQTFAIDIEASDRYQARQMPRQIRENGWATLRIARGRNQSRGLVIEPKLGWRRRCDRLAIDRDAIILLNRDGGMCNDHVVQRDTAGRDQALRVAARRYPGAREILSQSFAFHRRAF